MSQTATVYSFPSLGEVLGGHREPRVQNAPAPQTDEEREEALRKGYEEGLAQGRAAAEAELETIRLTARQEAADAGHAEGLAQAESPLAALSEALAQVENERRQMAQQIENFATELAVSMVGRLIEVDSVRADFIARMVASALKALAPQRPQVIYVSPADRALLEDRLKELPIKEDETLSPGLARVETGSLFVEGGIEHAFEQLKAAVFEVRTRRVAKRSKA
ncbi:MAG TPA: FliH/SctL family protein [Candidatus Binataceae bacterium]|nr:FliH/SctL family protein [Candidatus Binataceae bacterium]